MPNHTSIRRLARFATLALFLSIAMLGCGQQQAIKPRPAPVAPAPDSLANALLAKHEFAGAAAEFERLADAAIEPRASRYRLIATLAYLDTADRELANAAIAKISAPERVDANLYALTQLALDTTVTASASQPTAVLDAIDPSRFDRYQRYVYDRTSGKIANAAGDYSRASQAYLAADAYALPVASRAQLHAQLWRALSHMTDDDLAAARTTATGKDAVWYQLAIITKSNLHDSAAMASALETWRLAHPDHPGNLSVVEQIHELSEALSAQSRHVALILPFNGRFAAAARAIRDGFISAWYADTSGQRPQVSIYTGDAQTIVNVYQTAVAAGADIVVGPLEKSALDKLFNDTDVSVRTLALNFSENAATGETRFQFGLTPENEAIAVANKIWADGHSRAVAMVPQSAWGERVASAFRQQWRDLGGTLLSDVAFGGEGVGYAKAVKQALNIDQSETRAAELRRVLGRPIHYEPRRRADLEAIFLAGFPLGARQLLPQFRYFDAASVPMYATSHAFAGKVNTDADQDLDGLRFGDMPWLLGVGDGQTRTVYRNNWADDAAGSARLFAFGLDAYKVLSELARMRHQRNYRIQGETGRLSMDSDGRITRDLSWAQFQGGRPRLLAP